MENSLDAAESIGALPLIALTIEEFTEEEFNEHRGMDNRDVVDAGLFAVCITVLGANDDDAGTTGCSWWGLFGYVAHTIGVMLPV